LVSRVSIDSNGGQVRATGPESADNNNSWWSVSYEVFVPQNTDLTVTARNGGINIADVRGQIRFEGRNGGVHLKRLAGNVIGSTVNGGVEAELTGTIWDGRQLEVTTRNGGVSVTMPSSYSPAGIQCRLRRSIDSRHYDKRPREFHTGGLAVGGRLARVLVQRIVIGTSQIWNGSSSGNEPLLLAAGVDLGGESIEGCA
jgi:DUF4097 and DUF4098 domain-containing protein YvlB